MFTKDHLDERGEVPGGFILEKHGFNPHLVIGAFDYNNHGKMRIISDPKKKGKLVDKRGSLVNYKGIRIDKNGHVVDNFGRKTFDKTQLGQDGELPKLFTYNGRRFDALDCIG